MIWAIWLFLALEIAYLGLQPAPPPPAVARASGAGMLASVIQERQMLTFRLEGHPSGTAPALTIEGRANYADYLRYWDTQGSTTSVRLSYYAVAKSPAELLTYTWEAGGRKVSGTYLFVHPDYRFAWKSRDFDLFRIYYVDRNAFDDERLWSASYRQAALYLKLDPVEQTIYLMPSIKDVNRSAGVDFIAIGTFNRGRRSVFTSTELQRGALSRVLVHELAHSLLSNGNPPWWEEGIAVWVQGRTEAILTGSGRFQSLEGAETRLGALRTKALAADIHLIGLVRVARAASEQPLSDVLPRELGEPYGTTLDQWLVYVRGETFLADMKVL